MEYKYIANCSFGQDSIASVLTALKYQEPLDGVLYCEVMFDEDVSGEVPEHRDFIYGKAIPWLESRGIPVFVVRSSRTYLDVFYQVIKNSGKPLLNGKYTGFPLCGRCHIQSRCKGRTLNAYVRENFSSDTVQYIGILADEPYRQRRLESSPGKISLLCKHGIGRNDAEKMVKAAGLYSPVYEFSKRTGCWFCPNASKRELLHLKQHHSELWDRLLKLGEEDTASKRFDRYYTISQLNEYLEEWQWY